MSNQTRLAQVYANYLMAEGYQPRVDEEGDLVFKSEGKTYLILIDEDDPNFFQLVFPNFWSVDNEEERHKVLVAANAVNSGIKCVKIQIVRDSVWAVAELFVSSPEQATAMFERAMRALQAGVTRFTLEIMKARLNL